MVHAQREQAIEGKWRKIEQMLLEREEKLEINSGTMVEFFEGVDNLLGWIDQKLRLDCVAALFPADHGQLTALREQVEVSLTPAMHYYSVQFACVCV